MTDLRINLTGSTPQQQADFWAQAAAVAEPQAARVIKGVPLVKVGEWMASRSDGKAGVKVTADDIAFAVAASSSGKLPATVLGVSHPGFQAQNGKSKAPAVGTVENLRASDDGLTLVGDMHVGPKWLADKIDTAYPRRSARLGHGDRSSHSPMQNPKRAPICCKRLRSYRHSTKRMRIP